MGVRILAGTNGQAALYCSTSGFAFGPIFENESLAQVFLWWLGTDPRSLTDSLLEREYGKFLTFVDEWDKYARATGQGLAGTEFWIEDVSQADVEAERLRQAGVPA